MWVMCTFLLRWGRLLWVFWCAGLDPAQLPGRPCLVALLWAHWWAGRPPGATGLEGGLQDCAHQPWCQPRDRGHRNDCSQHPSPQGPAAACFSGGLLGARRWSGSGPSLLELRLCESLCAASGAEAVSCSPGCQLLALHAKAAMQKWGAGSRGTAPWPWGPLAGPLPVGPYCSTLPGSFPLRSGFPSPLLSFPPLPLCSDSPRIVGSDPRRLFGAELKSALAELPLSLPGRRWSVSLVFWWTVVLLAR